MLSKIERIDTEKLQIIINNMEKLQIDEQIRAILVKYLNRSVNGTVRVDYKQTNGGRHNAVRSLSLQNLKRKVRHTIASEYYVDIDMVNAHPVILSHLCHKEGFKSKMLDDYIKNRETVLKKLKVDRETGKKQYLIMTNSDGGDFEPTNSHQRKYYDEMINIQNGFAKKYPEEYAKHKSKKEKKGITANIKGSFMNTFLCKNENDILMEMLKYFKNPEDCVLCFDGIMLRNQKDYDIKGCMKHIKETLGINIQLKVKDMDEIIDLSEFKPCKPKTLKLDTYTDIEHLIGKELYPEQIDHWINNSISVINNMGTLMYVLHYPNKTHLCKAIEFEKTMNSFNCNVINTEYDHDFAVSNPKSKDIKAKPYLATNFGFGKGGYLGEKIASGQIKKYYEMDYEPYLKSKGCSLEPHVFNTFEEFEYDDESNTQTGEMFETSNLFRHLKEDFFNNNREELDHFLDSVADMIQDPATLKETAHVFYSKQGCGKGLLARFMEKLLGKANTITFNNSDLYFESRFNSDIGNRILKVFEEVSEKGKAFSNHNRLKAEITMSTERIESKGLNAFTTNHCARYWFFSNNKNTLYIENDDRRFTMHTISDRHANNKKYFKPIADEINNKNLMMSAFTYFANREYDEINVRTTFETDYKREQKQANLPNGIKFLIDWIEESYEKVTDQDFKVKSTVLREAYASYCEVTGVKYHLKTMQTQLEKLNINKPKKLRVEGVTTMVYVLNLKKLQDNVADYLKSPDWKFDCEVSNDKPPEKISEMLADDQTSVSASDTTKKQTKVKKTTKGLTKVKETTKKRGTCKKIIVGTIRK